MSFWITTACPGRSIWSAVVAVLAPALVRTCSVFVVSMLISRSHLFPAPMVTLPLFTAVATVCPAP